MKDKKFIALSSVFFLLFLVGMLSISFDKPTSAILRATNANPSALKSFIMVYPQLVPVGDNSAKISVYLRDINGEVLPNRNVKLTAIPSTALISPSDTQVTNNIGMAQFVVTSAIPGKIQLTASDIASGIEIVNSPSMEFTP